MPVFRLNSQRELGEDYQGINVSEFTYSDFENFTPEQIVDCFIHSNSFAEESRREIVKNSTGDIPFLRQAFEMDSVRISDFKKTDKAGLICFLDEYSNQNDWGETDGEDFIRLKDKFIQSLADIQSVNFYIISKEWFDETDKRLREPENWIYTYYFLIIWLDSANETLTVSEWTYD